MTCPTCDEGTGYLWDTTAPCPDCAKGHQIRYEQDKGALAYHEKQVRALRKRIKAYETRQNDSAGDERCCN